MEIREGFNELKSLSLEAKLCAAAISIMLIAIFHFYFNTRQKLNCSGVENDRGAIFLTRGNGTTTYRGEFCHITDCNLVANNMNHVEQAKWSCVSTKNKDSKN